MEQVVVESVRYSAPCQDCGAELTCYGTQALVDGRLRWDVDATCCACGSTVAVCGGDLPGERRDQMLAEHGPVTLHVPGAAANGAVIMRVLRAELGLDLLHARGALRRVRSGDYAGTLPEVELLARGLRASGVAATAVRP